MTKQSIILGTAWAGAAAAAVGLGLLAVGLIDADGATAATPAAATSTLAATPASTGTTQPSTPFQTQVHTTAGGTVYAYCDNGAVSVSAAPAAGWELDDSPAAGEVEFQQGDQRVEVVVTCGPDGPVFTADDRSGSTTSPSAPATSSSPASATPAGPTADDHGGSGGGSDDSGPDDHGSGGHGSDD